MRSLQNIGENKGLNVLKAVVDANVWISALLTSGNARGIKEKLKEARFQLFFANELLEECLDVIARPKFFGKINHVWCQQGATD
jgi:predicted nucleic acid-binding protein